MNKKMLGVSSLFLKIKPDIFYLGIMYYEFISLHLYNFLFSTATKSVVSVPHKNIIQVSRSCCSLKLRITPNPSFCKPMILICLVL